MKTGETLKICAAICEYNPFHNGHALHLEQMKKSGADLTAIVMSGNFTQRGEAAVLGKYERARHAVLAGADIVLELPVAFAVSSAEIFAEGAVKLVAALPGQKTLCFGAEKAEKSAFLSTAGSLSSESKEFRAKLKDKLKTGVPFAKARADALKDACPEADPDLLESPNNILGVEYTRAIVKNRYDIDILPVPRTGAAHLDKAVKGAIASSSAVRNALLDGQNKKGRAAFFDGQKKKVRGAVPEFVADDLIGARTPDFDALIYYALLVRSPEEIARTLDCSEGLENRLKAFMKDSADYRTLLAKAATKRYTDARIRRICLSNFLDIREDFIRKCLKSDLYFKVLAVREASGALSKLSEGAAFPFLTRRTDAKLLGKQAEECFYKDVFAGDAYDFLSGRRHGDFHMEVL